MIKFLMFVFCAGFGALLLMHGYFIIGLILVCLAILIPAS